MCYGSAADQMGAEGVTAVVNIEFDQQGVTTLVTVIAIVLLAGNITATLLALWALTIGRDSRRDAGEALTMADWNDRRIDEQEQQLMGAFTALATHQEAIDSLNMRFGMEDER